jgi:hypothetical protein
VGNESTLIFLPVLGQVVLTLGVYVALARAKARAAEAGKVDEGRRALHDDAWPESVVKINNNIRNQFEMPVLFYLLVIVLWLLGAAGALAQLVAWLFFFSRLVHAYIHIGSNYVPHRRKAFMFGALMLMIMSVLALWALAVG